MFSTLYIEEAAREHPRTVEIQERFSKRQIIECRHYGELFNPRGQNFRLQKQQPALVLALKQGQRVLPAPSGYGIGAHNNYYFSHMLNCIYDCRYCFLQGMYRSAHTVLFINYDEFIDDIKSIAEQYDNEPVHFFSGYDGDSLALEPLSGFAQQFVTALAEIPNAWLELRTKSTQVRKLLEMEVSPRCVTAFSFTPEPISKATEHGVPRLSQRLEAMATLQRHGWPIGIRLDPLIDCDNFETLYRDLLSRLFHAIDAKHIHSINYGPFRMPTGFFEQMVKLYPGEPLFAGNMDNSGGMISYGTQREQEMRDQLRSMLLDYVEPEILFPCIS
jgi:spore photoproduct lyase